MRRLDDTILERTKQFAHRVVDVAEAVESGPASVWVKNRIVSQLVGSGTSVGANSREADEASSRPEFCRCLNTVLRELSETRFWLEFVGQRGWLRSERLDALRQEADELARVFSVMIARVRRADAARKRTG